MKHPDAGANKVTRLDSARFANPSPRMSVNPFIANQFSCPNLKGRPAAIHTEQIKASQVCNVICKEVPKSGFESAKKALAGRISISK